MDKFFQDPTWQDEMRIQVDFNHLLAQRVGEAHGLTAADIEEAAPRAAAAAGAVQAQRPHSLRWMDLPYTQAGEIERIKAFATHARQTFKNFVVLGIGGSALGMTALKSALLHPWYNELSDAQRGGPRIYVLDNIDPHWLTTLLDILDPAETCFDVISKSGNTAETMSQFLWARQLLVERLGPARANRHIVATTDARSGSLRPLVAQEGWESFTVPDGVGGRFSVLCPVGLLPAAVVGISIDELLAGAAFADQRTLTPDVWCNPALLSALAHHLLDVRKGKHISVMMSYAQGLRDVADWYRQLWAESLGKRLDRRGQIVHTGQTPIQALGATDQHSQVQLYIEGPFDKVFSFLRVERFPHILPIPAWQTGQSAIDYLGGRTIAELLQAEAEATALALTAAQRPNLTFTLPTVNAFTVGQLFYLLEMQTAFAGEFYDVQAFDQPGVEAGKIATFALLGRPGWEAQRADIERQRADRLARWVL